MGGEAHGLVLGEPLDVQCVDTLAHEELEAIVVVAVLLLQRDHEACVVPHVVVQVVVGRPAEVRDAARGVTLSLE